MQTTHRNVGPFASILTGAVFISFSGVWVKWADVSPTVSAFYRVLFGALILTLTCCIRRDFIRLSPMVCALTMLCGLCFAADLYCWHLSIMYIGPGLATILGNFQVFLLTWISVLFFGDRVRSTMVLSIPLAFLGLFMIIGIGWSELANEYQTGIYLGLATALFYSAFLLTLRKIQALHAGFSFFYGLMLVSFASAFFLGLLIIFSEESFAIPNLFTLGSLFGLGLFSQTIGWAFISNSLPKVMPSIAGLILLLQPALAFVWDVLIFKRPTSSIQWLGVFITLIAIYFGMSSSRKPSKTGKAKH